MIHASISLTRAQVMDMLFATSGNLPMIPGHPRLIFQSIERESGCGRSMNIKAKGIGGYTVTLYCKITD